MFGINAFIRQCREMYRSFFRRHTRRMSVYEAEEKKLFFSKLYAICALMALISATFSAGTGGIPNTIIPPLFSHGDPVVYKIQPFKKNNSVTSDDNTPSSRSETTVDDSHSEKS